MPSRLDAPPDEATRSAFLGEGGTAPPKGEDLCFLMSTAAGVRVALIPVGVPVIVGRAPDATILVDDPSVSRRHVEVRIDDGIVVTDLGSRNGSRVDGVTAPPHHPIPLRLGSVVELGSATLLLQRAAGFAPVSARIASPSGPSKDGPIVRDPSMMRLYGLLDVIAPSPLAVLILGETGTGKEVFAAQVHGRSQRAGQPFLKLNCAAIPETLLEGELFGYERGAFTGAAQAKAGLFESADGGTVFLDEVGEIPLSTQAKLLRVLESGEVQRLGSLKSRNVDVRFVSATNRDLRAAIAAGRFRSDVYFRLNGVSLTLPPLRRRPLDIEPLANSFVERVSVRLGRRAPHIKPEARAALEAYAWPGNVRELRNVVERAVVMCQGRDLSPEHLMLADDEDERLSAPAIPMGRESSPSLPASTRMEDAPGVPESSASRDALKAKLEEMDRKAIVDALEKAAGNQSQAAKILGITRRALIYRIEQYGLARPRKRG